MVSPALKACNEYGRKVSEIEMCSGEAKQLFLPPAE